MILSKIYEFYGHYALFFCQFFFMLQCGYVYRNSIIRGKGKNKMTEENQTQDVKTFTQEDIDKLTADLTAKHQEEMDKLAGKLRSEFKEKEAKAKAEAEKQARQANMSELEKANETIKELESKYQEQADINALASQKDEARKLMSEVGVDLSCLDFCFVPKDIEATKAKIQAFKEYTDGVKKATFEGGVKSTVPEAGKKPEAKDDFEDGFDNGLHFNK